MTDGDAISLLSAIAQPVRLAIVRRLAETPDGMRAGDLAQAVGVTKALMSAHLAILRRAGAIGVSRIGREANVRLDRDAVAAVREWMAPLG